MILEAEGDIEKGWYEDQEELNSVRRIRKKELAALIGQTMLDSGLIKVTERKGRNEGDIIMHFETVVLNPKQLSTIKSMLHILVPPSVCVNVDRVMTELTGR